jgi:hypothetical protein
MVLLMVVRVVHQDVEDHAPEQLFLISSVTVSSMPVFLHQMSLNTESIAAMISCDLPRTEPISVLRNCLSNGAA